MAVIYRITNMANDHYYIGSAESFERRRWQHVYDLKRNQHKNPRLQAAWNKYGADMFVFEVLEEVPEGRSTFDVENTYLTRCVGQPDCYNINTDAIGMRTGLTMSEESKAKLSANRKGKHAGDQHYRYGKQLSEDIKAKISAAQKGKPNKMKGQKMSEQGRANVIAAVKRGEESHFYGKRPANADDLQKTVYARQPDGSLVQYPSLTHIRDTYGVAIGTVIRACKNGKTIQTGAFTGYQLSYSPLSAETIPEEYRHLPRTRQLAKEQGAKQYFTGIPCERGHLSPRAVKGTCIFCRREDEKRSRTVDTPSAT
jgi:group I intron endonuclease